MISAFDSSYFMRFMLVTVSELGINFIDAIVVHFILKALPYFLILVDLTKKDKQFIFIIILWSDVAIVRK